ncbi:MAG: DNA repair and recombination protein RadA [Thermoproteota archaeon]|jgi:DNA repair protein RadA|nr:DNA repair and recombination protein RadA [Thermoproteota archaeon]
MKEKSLSLRDIEGIGPATEAKLKEAGYLTVEAIAFASAKEISDATGLSYEKALEITENARKLLGFGFITAEEFYKKRQNIGYITTGSKALDGLLNGGIETQAITEIIGEFGTGKTQLCHQLAVNVQLPKERGGLDSNAIYIDTEGTFRPERIIQIATRLKLDPPQVLKRIYYTRAYNSDHQMFIVEELLEKMPNFNARLVIVDSLVSHFRSEYPGRENLVVRQQRLNKHIHDLHRIAMLYNAAVVVTNQIVAAPDVFFGNPNRPVGGHIIAHGCTYRLLIRKGKENQRIIKIYDSPMHPESETVFLITEGGIADIEED